METAHLLSSERAITELRPITLHCRDLTVSYGDNVAVDAVSFDVRRGEIFGLLGPNGAGKTSVIRALTTILQPTRGSATIAGIDLADSEDVRRHIGVLPESNGYPAAQTGRGYLRFYGQLFGLSREDADVRASRLLTQLGLGETNQRIATYSRGMRQRLGLCRSLINEPKVLFLDEPTLGLDPAGKEEIIAHLTQVAANRGTAVVLCTHLLDEVERVCDRVAILDRGRVVAAGTVDDVVDSANLAGTALLRLASNADVVAALRVLSSNRAVFTVAHDNTRPGDLDLGLAANVARPSNEVLGALVAADLEVRAFDRQSGSLNDAFLALTRRLSESP